MVINTLKKSRKAEIKKIKTKYKAIERIFDGEPAAKVARELGIPQDSILGTFRVFCKRSNPELYKDISPRYYQFTSKGKDYWGYKTPTMKMLIDNKYGFFIEKGSDCQRW